MASYASIACEMSSRALCVFLVAPLVLMAAACAKRESGGAPPSASATPQGGAVSSAEDLGRAVFDALRANDEARYQSLFAAPGDVDALASRVTSDRTLFEKRVRADVERGKSTFARVRSDAGINWDTARFGRVEATTGSSGGIEGADAKLVILQTDGREQRIAINNCMQTARGWVIGGTVRVP
jgi:hypothetical protein